MPLKPPTGGGAGSGDILQTASAVLAADSTTTSVTYVDLLSLTLTTAGGTRLEVYASFATSNAVDNALGGQDYLQLTIDGVKLVEGGNEQWTVTESGMITGLTSYLTDGSHTVKLQWRTTAGSTLRCSASTLTRPEHASLMVIETSG